MGVSSIHFHFYIIAKKYVKVFKRFKVLYDLYYTIFIAK